MSYVVLARKYRPRTFAEVTGQDVVTATLRGAIKEERVAHAYLLCGPRGTGKTTTARIFAKALNCEHGPTPVPCGECERCKSIDAGSDVDVIEIDAATHTGVEHVRALRDQAAYAPMLARHKIYIVDEAHQLSRPAFNALLKTLEEPPPHVKFVLATTAPDKVPDTILSRCQVLKLAPLSEELIAANLSRILAAEGVRAEDGVPQAIARRARGGMRDALSATDQLLALAGDEVALEHVRRLSGGADREALERLVEALAGGDAAGCLALLPELEGGESELADGLLAHLRACLLAAHCGADSPLIEIAPEAREGLDRRARALGSERLELMLEELLFARDRMQRLPAQARLILELVLIELARAERTLPLAELAQRLEALEGRLGAAQPPPAVVPRPQAAREVPQPPARHGATRSASASASVSRAARSSTSEAWTLFLAQLASAAPSLAEVLERGGRLVEIGPGRALVRCDGLGDAERALIADARNRRRCAQVFSSLLGEQVELRIEDGAEVRPGVQDPYTRSVADLFGGRIED